MEKESFYESDPFKLIISIFTGVWLVYVIVCIVNYQSVIGDTIALISALTGFVIFIIHMVIMVDLMSRNRMKDKGENQ